NALPDIRVAREDVAIDFLELGGTDKVRSWIEVVQVAEQIPERVPDLPVRFGRPRKDLLADADVLRVVAHRDPQPQDVGAGLLDDIFRLDGVAERLRHLLAVFGDDETVGDDLLVRRAATRAEADEQRALEPAAMPVGAFE